MANEAEDVFTQEIESSLREDGAVSLDTESADPESLPANPLHFVVYYLKYYKWPLLAMALFELGQAWAK